MGMSSASAVTSVAESSGGGERSRGDDVAERGSAAGVELLPSPTTTQLAMQYKMAIFWSAFIGLGALNWGLDILLCNISIAVPYFRRDFGRPFEDDYLIPAGWQIALLTASAIGMFFGALLSGFVMDSLGKLRALQIVCTVSIGAVFMQVFARGRVLLLVGRLINGVAVSSFLTIPSGYAAEICPVKLRGLTTSGVQLFIAIGQLLANVIFKATGDMTSSLSYRLPFALQFIIPVILLLGVPFCPESPWHLVQRCQYEDAKVALTRLGCASPESAIEEISQTLELEVKYKSSKSYLDCFRESDRRRTEISMGIFAAGQFTGVVFVLGYSTYFFQLAGLSSSASFSLSIGVSLLGLAGVVTSWFVINRIGRRPIMLYGVFVLFILLLIIGILDVVPSSNKGPVYGQVTCIILFAFFYLLSPGSMAWTLYAEIPSARMRSRTVSLGVLVQALLIVLMNTVIPLLINPDAANLQGKIGFIFGGATAISLVWIYFRVPETARRSFAELDWLFEHGISARKFKSTDPTINV